MSGSARAARWRPWAPPLALALGVAALYGRTHGYPLVGYDDPQYLLQSPHVSAGLTWAGALWALTATYHANWHPLTWLSYMLDVELFGPSAGAHHGVNALLHGVNAVLLYGLLRRTTGATWRSALVAALFAVHPLRVESVAWVAERKDVLSTCFALLALGAYARYAKRPGVARYLVVAGCFALGLMAKPMVVTLPCLMLVLDRWPLGRREGWGRLALEKVPLLALAAGASALAVAAQGQADAVITWENAPFAYRGLNALASYGVYVAQALVPVGLAPFYPHPRHLGALPLAAGAGGAAVVAAGSAAAWCWRRRRPWFAVGWLWYLGTLVPVIGLVQVGDQAHADRYTYLPLVGLFLIGAWAAGEAAGPGGPRRAAVVAGAAGALAAFSALTWAQVGHWRSTEALFRHALAVDGRNWLAHNTLAADLLAQGRDAEALAHVEEALGLNPGLAEAH
ncbi:MAG: glycosyltransferase family 39 protein, partial [Deferrisomatales bacterium]